MLLAANSISALLSLLAVIALPSNDLLDYIPAAAYWQIKHIDPTMAAMSAELSEISDTGAAALIDDLSNPDPQRRSEAKQKLAGLGRRAIPALRSAIEGGDPETVSVARELIGQISAQSKPLAVRRLMAIRALGESGDADAAAVLRKVLKSTEPFEAEYAAAAIAALRHQLPATRPAAALEERQADAWHLPGNCEFVWQSIAWGGHPLSLDAVFAQEMAVTNEPRDRLMEENLRPVIAVAEAIGNVRLQSATFGMSGVATARTGFLVISLRGEYDSAAAAKALRDQHVPVRSIAGVDVYMIDIMGVIMPSDQRLIAILEPETAPLEGIVAAVMQGQNDLHGSADMLPLLKSADMSEPVWGVGKVTGSYRALAPVLGPFDTVKVESAVMAGSLHIRITAGGSNAAGAQASANMVNAGVGQLLGQVRPALSLSPMGRPVVKVLESIQCRANGGNGILTLQTPLSLGEAILEAGGAPAGQ